MMRALATALTLVLAVFLAGCGEKTQVTVYKQGQYQGKPDNLPWANDQFKSDRVAWDKAIKGRNDAQNEYVRIGR
jgi:hypothetical protein